MFGYNDYRYYGTDTTGVWTYRNALYSAMGWMLARTKDFRDDASFSYVGTWGDANITPATTAYQTKYTKTQNDSLIYTFSGPTVYLATWASADSGAVYTVAVDGDVKATGQGKKYLTPYVARSFGPQFYRITGLAAGAHSLTVKKTDATGTYLWVHWAGVPDKGPNVIMCNAVKSNAYGYSVGSPFNKGTDEIVAYYNAMLDTAVTAFRADGARVWQMDAASLIDVHADLLADSIHIDDAGHGKIFQAIRDTINTNWQMP